MKLIKFATGPLCILVSTFAYAQDYYSTQNPNGGYTTTTPHSGYYSNDSQSSSNTYTIHPHNDKHSQFSVSFNLRNHHRRGPHWADMFVGYPNPPFAVVGGNEPNAPYPLFICHANYNGGIHPGKIVAGKCNITWGGREISLNRYDVLQSQAPLSWIAASNGFIPGNAVIGGYENGKPIYICQANYNGGIHPGKIVGQMCNIGYAGREISFPFYNVLVG
jgi:hypothetical protein